MKQVSRIAAATAIFVGLQFSGQPQAEAQDTLPPIVITGYETFGKGCPQQSVTILSKGSASGGFPGDAKPGSQWVAFDLPEYFANVDPTKTADGRSCEIRLHLEAGTGVRTFVNTIKFVGTASLDQGVVAQLDATYLWTGKPIQSRSQTPHRLTGFFEGPFAITDTVEGQQPSACNSKETFVIQSSINLTNSRPARGGEFVVNQTQVDITSAVRSSVFIEFAREPCTRRL